MFEFFDAMAKKGKKVESVALFYEDTIFGSDSAAVQRKLAGEKGIKVLADIKYRANSPSLTSEVQQLKAANAQVLMPSSYTTDAILLMKTMAELGYKPSAIVAQDAGFSEQALFNAIGPQGEGAITRSTFSLDLAAKKPSVSKVNELFKARSGKDLNDLTARQFTALFVMADAINRSKTAEPLAIRDALVATDLPGDQTILPWRRVKFDETGQNQDCTPVLLQRQGPKYVTIYPPEFAAAEVAWGK
jgi:branched-chain amino acid transport system substrate-binding protein